MPDVCGPCPSWTGKGDKRIEADAKAIAYELDPQAVVDRAARAERERTVTIRPAPDNMTHVTRCCPWSKVCRCTPHSRRAADTTFDGRGRGQVMADTAYERITGHPAEVPTPIAVNLVLTDETLLGGDEHPGPSCRATGRCPQLSRAGWPPTRSPMSGPKPPCAGSTATPHPVRWWRWNRGRGCSRLRLARFIAFRDDTCRTPYCDAPIRHTDHATPHARGGATTAANGLGTCEACNYAKEAPGWRVHTIEAHGQRHTAEYITPTGAHHQSHAPPLLNDVVVFTPSAVETRIAHHLAGLPAA